MCAYLPNLQAGLSSAVRSWDGGVARVPAPPCSPYDIGLGKWNVELSAIAVQSGRGPAPLPVVGFRFGMGHWIPAARHGGRRPEAGFWPERPRTGRRLL